MFFLNCEFTKIKDKYGHIHGDEVLTLSAGIAALKKKDDPVFWLDCTDKALYYAKAHSKNQIKLSDEF